ncbi:hypothetical protein KVA01_05590 [Kocuria varians]|uniref:Uncharacterized protein n=1 Tax=Kocuria varians TaxID=1272 RepID=A0A4Y4D3W8_KOCVA|nr:hypothetical protein [Kocuria varians]GEC98404.1 hypothetical protein KVA01_05590 [Kocuria varians]
MPDSAASTVSRSAPEAPPRGISTLLLVALVLAVLCALSLVTVLVAAAGGHVIWAGFTLFPAICFPIAFLLMCVELLRGARRRART